MSAEIIYCPFCSGFEQRVKHSSRWGWFVSCRCGAAGPSSHTREEAIELWNTRGVPEPEPMQQMFDFGDLPTLALAT